MKKLLRRYLVLFLSLCLILLAVPRPGTAGSLPVGSSSAESAAGLTDEDMRSSALHTGGLKNAYAYGDTTEYDFPEDEQKQKELVRDIAVFVVVAAFVAFFVIKVFLEGDTDEPPPLDPGGKPLP